MIRTAFVCVAILVWATPAPLAAQVDYRVDYRQGGDRSFDANNRIGSGGLNPQPWNGSPYSYSYGAYANQVITGNVTGLGGFQGPTALPGVNQFRGGLQSDELSSFRARSVNYAQVRNGTAQRSTAYYDPSTSIADVGAIRAGLNQPGSSFLRSPQVRLPTYAEQFTRDQLLGIDDYATRRSASPMDIDASGIGRITQRPIVADDRARGDFVSTMVSDPYRSAMQSTLFGSPQLEPEPPSARTGSAPSQPPSARLSTELSRDELLGIVDKQRAVEPEIDLPATSGEEMAPQSFDPLVDGMGRFDRAVLPTPEGEKRSHDELYGRMLDAVQQIQVAGQLEGLMAHRKQDVGNERDPLSGLMIGSKRRKAMDVLPGGVDSQPDMQPVPDAAVPQGEASEDFEPKSATFDPAAEWAELFMRTPIRSFSLGGASRVGKYLRAAEESMKKGDFNRASRLFDLAATVDPENPLPQLGRANAQIAAGQYVSAVISLEAGIRLFPEIAAFELDLPTLSGQPDVFDRRRADLESILSRNEQYELRFLLGYIELYSGLHFDGLNDLEAAAKNAPAGSVIADFPDLLLGRKPLGREP
ncbi:MAG: hypothetical protein H6819_08765 [Phycisphaerales bacterium]|nr:hypothetical protein [Phycisphaerales bacterium]MCB9855677.1 hypothetical protein [Phycisphaerales bacterium]MCB9862572.1 hypothetical protein [Phycisphaerales bacterium]